MLKTLILIYFIIAFFTFNSKAQDFWENLNLPDSMGVYSITVGHDGKLYLNGSGVYVSEDEGAIWQLLGLYGRWVICSDVYSNGIIFAGVGSVGSGIYKFYNGNWEFVFPSVPNITSIYITTENNVIAGTWGGLYKSSDSGYTWTQVLLTVNMEVFNDIIEKDSFLFTGSTHFMSSTGGGVYRSSDHGDTWEHIALSGQGIESFAIKENGNLLAGSDFNYSGSAFGVFESEDGFQWDNILQNKLVTSVAVDFVGGMYSGCSNDFGGGGLWYSDDGGQNWISKTSGMHVSPHITKIKVSSSGYIYSTTYNPNCLYRSINPIVSISEKSREQLDIKVFPNPFQDRINLHINGLIYNNEKLTIKIFNSLGQIIYSFENSVNNEFSINLEKSPSGLYYYSIRTETTEHNTKLIKK